MTLFFWLTFAAATFVLLGYFAIFLLPDRRRLFEPTDRDARADDAFAYPPVAVVVPARNEATALPRTLPTWLAQDYPALKKIVLVDDRSTDGTADLARRLAAQDPNGARLEVKPNPPLPARWAGKVWAMHNGVKRALEDPSIRYVLLTDADIAHTPDSLRLLVRESERLGLGFNSRMARLRCKSFAEKWLIPPFLYFFLLLYPLKRANNPRSRMASGAGGCVLLSRTALEALGGGLEPICGCLIDDVNLAHALKRRGMLTRLSLSLRRVESTRPYPHVRDIADMVNRSAYCQLNYNPWKLAACLLAMGVIFVAPVLAVALGVYGMGHPHAFGAGANPWLWCAFLSEIGLAALALQLAHFYQAVKFFNLMPWHIFLFPFAGLAYAGMTWQSAWRHWRRRAQTWRAAKA